ncbi:MAG: transcription antitermination factor NusA-like protein [Candidatus Nanohaloarchaea archaeon]|jgi:transcription antitermination factor NusA-like protein
MKAPICNVCLKSEDELCSMCEDKFENGEITETDIEVSRILHNLSKEHASLKDSEIIKTFEAENVVVIATAKGDGAKVVGRSGEIVKKVADEVGKSIRVVEKSEDDLETIKGLLSPAEVESVNTVFTPEGQEKKIVVSDEYEGKINISEEEFEDIIEGITGTKYRLSFE